jgi:hypothetical protein
VNEAPDACNKKNFTDFLTWLLTYLGKSLMQRDGDCAASAVVNQLCDRLL